ncbi:MAG TPA: low molecular weight protein-tyrosine-phosphatase [Prolixibacteraceae bacterium]|nr:low molecular weight protein-tyrosine-phosphatase [Prolixibacteraceae bacterium]
MRILFVCLGNICRSPAAEGIFNNLLKIHNLEDRVTSDSAGILGYHEGEGAYHKMKNIALKRGYHLLSVSRPVRPEHDFENFDLIIGMDDQNIADLNRMAPTGKLKSKIRKMTDFCTRHNHKAVPDPYYGESKDYELVVDLLEDACEGLIAAIKSA